MPIVPSYKRDLQCYGGLMDASAAVPLDNAVVAKVTFDATLGPTAYNCSVSTDDDNITVYTSGIYRYSFEADVTIPTTAAEVTVSVRDDATNITGALASVGFITAELATKRHLAINGIAQIAAGSVLDVVGLCSVDQTATFTNARFWVRKIAPAA